MYLTPATLTPERARAAVSENWDSRDFNSSDVAQTRRKKVQKFEDVEHYNFDAFNSFRECRTHLEVIGLGPDVSVVAADQGVGDHLGLQQLTVDVGLPGSGSAVTTGGSTDGDGSEGQ